MQNCGRGLWPCLACAVLVGTCVGAGGNVQSLGECFSVNVKAETPFPTPNCDIAIAPSETPAMLPLTQLCRI